MPDETTDRMRAQSDEHLAAGGNKAAMRQATQKQGAKLENEYFLNELRKHDLDSEVFDWLADEFPSWFSGARAVSNRGDRWDEQADLLVMNKRERAYAESNPGRLLQDRPFLNAVAQGADSPPASAYTRLSLPREFGEEYWRSRLARAGADGQSASEAYRAPMTSAERRAAYGAAEVSADLMALSRQGAGLDATTTATTETRVRRETDEESTASRLGTVFE